MKKLTIYQIASCALMAALLCILAPVSIPVGAVPITLATFVIYLSVYILGPVGGTISTAIYLLLGLAGLPVFSGYTGGVAKLAGPTGGYLVGYLFITLIGGIFVVRSRANLWFSGLGLILGTAVLYLFGTVWFVILMDVTFAYALTVCVLPFLLVDLCKIVVATLVGKPVRSALEKAGLSWRLRK